jgi:hypothetical protein
VNLLRKASLVVAAGMAACAMSLPAQANRLAPHWYAYSLLYDYGDTYQMQQAGCVKWNYRTLSWYTRCGLPQNAALHYHAHHRHHHRHVLSVRD